MIHSRKLECFCIEQCYRRAVPYLAVLHRGVNIAVIIAYAADMVYAVFLQALKRFEVYGKYGLTVKAHFCEKTFAAEYPAFAVRRHALTSAESFKSYYFCV